MAQELQDNNVLAYSFMKVWNKLPAKQLVKFIGNRKNIFFAKDDSNNCFDEKKG